MAVIRVLKNQIISGKMQFKGVLITGDSSLKDLKDVEIICEQATLDHPMNLGIKTAIDKEQADKEGLKVLEKLEKKKVKIVTTELKGE
jgi:hypothetical protein